MYQRFPKKIIKNKKTYTTSNLYPHSSFYNIYPTTSPARTFFGNLIHVGEITACAAGLDSVDCTNTLNFTSPSWTDNSSWVDPDNLLANGTQTLYNTAGSITSPISGSTLIWTFGAATITAIAAPYTAAGAAAATSGGAEGAGASGGGETETATASVASGSKSSAADALILRSNHVYVWGMAILSAVVLYV
jgi:hypothetical protein